LTYPAVLIEDNDAHHDKKKKTLDQKVDEELEEEDRKKYISLNWINPTSNVVERFFSILKRVFNPNRRGMNADNLERILFLKMNKMLWDLNDIVFLYGN
jgi:hypothetical protein